MKKHLAIAALGLLALFMTLFIPLPAGNQNAAASGSAVKLMGGVINMIIDCSCMNAQLLIVGAPRAGNFLYVRGLSRLFPFSSVKISSWVLGIASPAALECLVPTGRGCASAGSGYPIIMFGTSH